MVVQEPYEAAARQESEILDRQHTMTTTAATHEEAEILEQHTMTTAAAANDETEILEQKHAATAAGITNEETEILEQSTAVTAARNEETIDGKDQEFLALIERRKNGQKRQGPSERHQQEDQTGNQRQQKIRKT